MRRTRIFGIAATAAMTIMLAMSVYAGGDAEGGASGAGSEELTPLRVQVFDRGNAPEGAGTATDNDWTEWIQRETQEIGLDVEFAAAPRSEEVQQINIWMASGNAPDIMYTYNAPLLFGFAEQGGLQDLEGAIEEHGPAIQTGLADALEYGVFQGQQVAIPGRRDAPRGPQMKIRQDWLDALGMDAPTNIEELTEVLRAFKEQDPGNVGPDRVVPFAVPAPGVVGRPGFYLNVMFGFGVKNDGPDFPTLPGGNYEDGEYRSPVDHPAARAFYRWMNQLYKEGLLHPEFAVDTRGTRWTQHVSSGVAGFIDTNQPEMDPVTIDAVPDVDWQIIEPLVAPDGSQTMNRSPVRRFFNFVPVSSDVADAAVKYINWQVEAEVDTALSYGFEGVQHDIEDGIRVVREDMEDELHFAPGDLNLIGAVNSLIEPENWAAVYDEKVVQAFTLVSEYGVVRPVISEPTPVAQELRGTLQRHVFEGAAKVIVADDFESAYDEYVEIWYSLGGGDYDQEIEDFLDKQ